MRVGDPSKSLPKLFLTLSLTSQFHLTHHIRQEAGKRKPPQKKQQRKRKPRRKQY